LHIPVSDIFTPLVPVQLVGLAFVFIASYLLGRTEESRVGLGKGSTVDFVQQHELSEAQLKIRRPQNFWANIVLTVFVLGVMISGKVDPVV
ncbi:citrate transporter, partial [Acinetobacter baumannii]